MRDGVSWKLHTGGEEELNPYIVRRKTAPAGAVTANFGNLVSRSATHGHKCDEECRYLGCNRSMTPSGMKAPRSPPTSQKTNPSRVLCWVLIFQKGCLTFSELRAKRCKSHQACAEQSQGHPAVRNRFGVRREREAHTRPATRVLRGEGPRARVG